VLYLGTIVATVTSMRARLPLLPMLLPFAGYLALRVTAADRSVGRLALALVLGGAAALVPVYDAQDLQRDLDKREFNLATYRIDEGDLEGAAVIAQRLADSYPGTSRVETLLADIESRQGFAGLDAEGPALGEAQERIQSALNRLRVVVEHPATNGRELFRANSLAGWIQLQLGNASAAERRFRAALEFDDGATDLRLALANALHLGGRKDEALAELGKIESTPAAAARLAELRAE